jgi:hypothetical protein
MKLTDIQEGKNYGNDKDPQWAGYYRTVWMIVDTPNKPGGKTVLWKVGGEGAGQPPTPGRLKSTHHAGQTSLKNFAVWATHEVVVKQRAPAKKVAAKKAPAKKAVAKK